MEYVMYKVKIYFKNSNNYSLTYQDDSNIAKIIQLTLFNDNVAKIEINRLEVKEYLK